MRTTVEENRSGQHLRDILPVHTPRKTKPHSRLKPLNPQTPQTQLPKPQNPKPSTLNPKPKPQTLNPKPQVEASEDPDLPGLGRRFFGNPAAWVGAQEHVTNVVGPRAIRELQGVVVPDVRAHGVLLLCRRCRA